MLRILVVDDEPALLSLQREFLAARGWEVDAALSARDGLRQLDDAGDRPYALVILDWSLPDLSGRDLLRAVRERAPTARLVVQTGYGESVVADIPGDEAVAEVLRKPSTLKQLEEVIRRLLGEAR